MKQLLKRLTLCSLLLASTAVQANDWFATRIGGYVGVREDSLEWQIKDDGCSSPLITKYCFDDFKLVQKGVFADFIFCDSFYLKLRGDYGGVYNKARGGESYDLMAGVGYDFKFLVFNFAPVVGYTYEETMFRTCASNNTCVNPTDFSAFENNYRNRWYGPWLGFEWAWQICCDWRMYNVFTYHWTRFKARGTTTFGDPFHNTISAKDNFDDSSKKAHGFDFIAGLQYKVCESGTLDISGYYEQRQTKHGKRTGTHTVFSNNVNDNSSTIFSSSAVNNESEVVTKIHNKIDRIEWRTFAIQFGGSYKF